MVLSWLLRGLYSTADDSEHPDRFDIVPGGYRVSSWKDKTLTDIIQLLALKPSLKHPSIHLPTLIT